MINARKNRIHGPKMQDMRKTMIKNRYSKLFLCLTGNEHLIITIQLIQKQEKCCYLEKCPIHIPHHSYMTCCSEHIEKSRTNKKLGSLENRVCSGFERSRNLLYPAHDMDLKRWAIRESRINKSQNFVASDKWILNFK